MDLEIFLDCILKFLYPYKITSYIVYEWSLSLLLKQNKTAVAPSHLTTTQSHSGRPILVGTITLSHLSLDGSREGRKRKKSKKRRNGHCGRGGSLQLPLRGGNPHIADCLTAESSDEHLCVHTVLHRTQSDVAPGRPSVGSERVTGRYCLRFPQRINRRKVNRLHFLSLF